MLQSSRGLVLPLDPGDLRKNDPIPMAMQSHDNGGYIREGVDDWLAPIFILASSIDILDD